MLSPATRNNTLTRWVLGLLPFVLIAAVYLWASHLRLEANPQDKLLPSLAQMIEAMGQLIFEPDSRTGQYQFVSDTWNSLRRLLLGVSAAAIAGLFVGVNMGLHRGVKDVFGPFLTFIALVPPLSILPILFIALGVEEFSKITLIFIGVFPLIARDVLLATEQIPRENLVKALTLGATPLGVTYRVVMPQVVPRLIDTVRLALGGAWLFLIAAEAIASTEGLGYRIFLVRRYLAMDVILPYVAWITFLGFSMDWLLRAWLRRRFRWYVER
ncbi:MAG TPA: ABC transporter permease subunit [Burkholderiaceae bacterium]|nr:ABC transporter permease subunit [Burkholderiaceae bacterium]